jgi:hypothetical protein
MPPMPSLWARLGTGHRIAGQPAAARRREPPVHYRAGISNWDMPVKCRYARVRDPEHRFQVRYLSPLRDEGCCRWSQLAVGHCE